MAKPSQIKPKPKQISKPKTWGAGSSPEEIRSVGKGTSINSREAKRREEILRQSRESISPESVARYEAEARKALEEKYPGMFIPETRKTPGVKKK
jgi:hypothetical protein